MKEIIAGGFRLAQAVRRKNSCQSNRGAVMMVTHGWGILVGLCVITRSQRQHILEKHHLQVVGLGRPLRPTCAKGDDKNSSCYHCDKLSSCRLQTA